MKPSLQRTPSRLSDSLQRHVNAYALAATAAGVGMLALSQPAEARIVYTRAHRKIQYCDPHHACFGLDLNHDGIVDFRIPLYSSVRMPTLLVKPANKINAIYGTITSGGGTQRKAASALGYGVKVGPSPKLMPSNSFMYGVVLTKTCSCEEGEGPWGKIYPTAYLGLKFYVKGKAHYGWARIRRNTASRHPILTGYAYETVANKPIITGKTKGADVIGASDSASLGRLAQGSAGLAARRPSK
jgi:hypothetical protein